MLRSRPDRACRRDTPQRTALVALPVHPDECSRLTAQNPYERVFGLLADQRRYNARDAAKLRFHLVTRRFVSSTSGPKSLRSLGSDAEFYEARLWRRGNVGDFRLPPISRKVFEEREQKAVFNSTAGLHDRAHGFRVNDSDVPRVIRSGGLSAVRARVCAVGAGILSARGFLFRSFAPVFGAQSDALGQQEWLRSFGLGFWGLVVGGGPWGQPCHWEHHLVASVPWYQQLMLHRYVVTLLTPRQRKQFLIEPITGFPKLWWRLLRESNAFLRRPLRMTAAGSRGPAGSPQCPPSQRA
jgi:hypothetical protein